ncbi:MAG: TIM barrel protein [Opitutales bacterium]|nr:TIM barrel protein [Opitutales bacterium]
MLKQSVVLPAFHPERKLVSDHLDSIKSIGFPAIEIWGRDAGYEEVFEAARSKGLEIVSMVGHEHESPTQGSHAEGFSRKANHDRLEHELKESIDIAVKWGIPGLIVLSGHRNFDESDYQGLVTCAEGLKRIVPYAEERGVNLNMELLNTTVDHPNYLCDSTDWAIALCEMVNSKRCRILYDIYHMQIMEGNLCNSIRRASKWIGHYHTAGNPGRHELDDGQELNYAGICKTINSTGYDLFVGHEFFPKGDPVKGLREAYEICNV